MSVQVIDKGWIRIQRELKHMTGAYVKVGYPEEKSKAHAGGSGGGKSMDVAGLAAIHEFGTSAIPARPFLAQAFDENLQKVTAMIKAEESAILEGKRTTKQALEKLGAFYQGAIKTIFLRGQFAPLKPATIARKGSNKPLIDTGQLRGSVDFEVIEGKK